MKVKDLISELSKYDPDKRVILYNHGRDSTQNSDEIQGCFTEKIYDENDNVIEEVVSLYEY